jgi:hypothetical protein
VVCSLLFILCFHCHSVVLWPIGPLSGPFIVTVGYHASVCVNNFYGGYQSHREDCLVAHLLICYCRSRAVVHSCSTLLSCRRSWLTVVFLTKLVGL